MDDSYVRGSKTVMEKADDLLSDDMRSGIDVAEARNLSRC